MKNPTTTTTKKKPITQWGQPPPPTKNPSNPVTVTVSHHHHHPLLQSRNPPHRREAWIHPRESTAAKHKRYEVRKREMKYQMGVECLWSEKRIGGWNVVVLSGYLGGENREEIYVSFWSFRLPCFTASLSSDFVQVPLRSTRVPFVDGVSSQGSWFSISLTRAWFAHGAP